MCDAAYNTTTPPADMAGSRPQARPGCVELDRFCPHCGYNLRTLPITRQPETGIWVVRCTECGSYQAASELTPAYRPWLNYMTKFLIIGWMVILLALMVNLVIAQSVLSYAVLDELTTHRRLDALPDDHPAAIWRRASHVPISQWSSAIVLRESHRRDAVFQTVMLGVSTLVSFALGALAVVVLPHWRRWTYFAMVLGAAAIAQGSTYLIWRSEAPYLLSWAAPIIGRHLLMQVLGGALGIAFGRPAARLAIRVLLPPSLRPRLAYLWLADGKPLPAGQTRREIEGVPVPARTN